MLPAPLPVNVIDGATGAGKTTAIRDLLAQRPDAQRWAVLVNDFGASTLAGAPGVAEGQVTVREVAGCICCTAQVGLRTGLIALIREARPHRLLIEASASADPAAILRVLREPGIASAIEVRASIAAAHLRQLADARYLDNDLYRVQLEAADVVVLSRDEAASENERRAARAALAGVISAQTRVLDRTGLKPSVLDLPRISRA